MYKIAVLGDRDSIYGFGALGLEVFPVEEAEAGARLIRRLAGLRWSGAVHEAPLPAVVPIPGISGNTGLGLRQVKRSVEQAVGSDILANES